LQVTAYLKGLQAHLSEDHKPEAPPLSIQVSNERLQAAGTNPDEWLTYSGSYNGWRHTSLAEITPANAARLNMRWVTRGLSRCPKLLDHAFPGGCDEQRPSQTARGKISDGLECQRSHPYSAALLFFAQPIVAVTWDNGISHGHTIRHQ
jgi:hypothetical protein